MQHETMFAVLAGLAGGFALGLVCFGGLWWTTRQLVSSPHPARLMLASFVLRLGILGAGLAVMARLGLAAALMAVAGLLLARGFVIRRVKNQATQAARAL